MQGQIKLGRWRRFTARKVLAPPGGYLWAATARLAGLPVTGYDRLGSGTGEMRWRLLRLIPVLTAEGPDITRSAYGRLAGEIALIPTAFRHAAWSRSEDANTVVATWQFGDDTEVAELRVKRSGRLAEIRVVLLVLAAAAGQPSRLHPRPGAVTSARAPARGPKTGCRRHPAGLPTIPFYPSARPGMTHRDEQSMRRRTKSSPPKSALKNRQVRPEFRSWSVV